MENNNRLRERLMEIGKKQGWWETSSIVVALSGGGDSMALLTLLRQFFRGTIYAAHMEHGIRRGSSQEDALFVERYCKENSVRCFIEQGDILQNMQKGESVEMAARRIRYKFLERVRITTDSEWIATGHTADDVAETVLLNIGRGSGLRGLVGILGQREHLIRPILSFTRNELRRYLISRGIDWREDETNFEKTYTRNKIRHELLPWLTNNLNTKIEQRLLDLAEISGAHTQQSEKKASQILMWLKRAEKQSLSTWDRKNIGNFSEETIKELIRFQGEELWLTPLSKRKTDKLAELILSSSRWRFQWQNRIEVCADTNSIAWVQKEQFTPPKRITITIEHDTTNVTWGDWDFELTRGNKKDFWFKDYSATIPWDGISPVTIESLSDFNLRDNKAKVKTSSWWLLPGWPVIRTNSDKNCWSPKQYIGYCESDKCVIIVKVKESGMENKKGCANCRIS